jgi:Ankyrin repeats (3 copies)
MNVQGNHEEEEEVRAVAVIEHREEEAEAPAPDPAAITRIFALLRRRTVAPLRRALEGRPDLVRVTDDAATGWTLLHHIVHMGLPLAFAELVVGAWPGIVRERGHGGRAEWGQLPVHLVNARTVREVAALLVQAYPEGLRLPGDLVDHPNCPLEPFHCALRSGASVGVVRDLLEARYKPEWDASPSHDPLRASKLPLKDPLRVDGVKALSLALQAHADVQVIRLVREAWPDAIHDPTHPAYGYQWSALHDAIQRDASPEVVSLLAQWRPKALHERDADGNNLPIHLLYPSWSWEHHRTRRLLARSMGVARALLEAWLGSLLEANPAGEYPLHRAVRSGWLPLVRLLAEQNSEALKVREAGSTPLHVAAAAHADSAAEAREILTYLVEQGRDAIELRDAHGLRPLEVAAATGATLDVLFMIVSTRPESVRFRRRTAVPAENDDVTEEEEEEEGRPNNNPRPRQRRRHHY